MATNGAAVLQAPRSPTSAYDRTAPAPSFSLSFGAKKAGSSAQSQSKKRSHLAFTEDAGDEGVADQQQITTFGANAAEPTKVERVIRGVPNADWQDPARRKRQWSGIPGHEQPQNRAGEVVPEKINTEEPKFGLNVVQRDEDARTGTLTPPAEDEERATQIAKPKTADEEALEALQNGKRSAPKVITPPSEEDAFGYDYDEAPDAPTMATFTATPVEGFGAALLRGYVKPGQTLEDLGYNEDGKDTAPKRRAGLLGLGAKESGLGVELGAWGKGAKGQQKGEGYNPLSRKNVKTGEILTDEELKAKIERQREEEKNQKYVNGQAEHKERRREERDHQGEQKRIEYRESKSSRKDREYEESDRYRDRRRDREDDDDRRDRRRREDDHDRRRRSRDRDHDSGHDRRRHGDRSTDSRDDRDGHRRRERDSHRSSRR